MIIGAGPAGLAAAHALSRKGVKAMIIEASAEVGGNARTLQHQGHRFDTGAHRFHAKIPEVTEEVQRLMGDELLEVSAPSMIFENGKFIPFPFHLGHLLRHLQAKAIPAMASWLGQRMAGPPGNNFAEQQLHRYGRVVAERFLLSYSRKLWGIEPEHLATEASGGRLRGLNWKSVLFGARAHLDGRFYYPVQGIGQLWDKHVALLEPGQLQLRTPLTAVRLKDGRITGIRAGTADMPVSSLWCSLPPPVLLSMMTPAPPRDIMTAAQQLRFRSLVLIGFRLARTSITPNASIYFPDANIPFTRVVEPKNRSLTMSPPGETMLVTEIPCEPDEVPTWLSPSGIEMVQDRLLSTGLILKSEILDHCTAVLGRAYPVLDRQVMPGLTKIQQWLGSIPNLTMIGRSGGFAYSHIHEHIAEARRLADEQFG